VNETTLGGQAGYLIKEVQHILRKQMDRALTTLGITTPQFAVLTRLKEAPGLSNAELAVLCFVTPQTMNLILQKLEEKGLVVRTPSKTHGKIINTKLTAPGGKTLVKANALLAHVETDLFGKLSDTELEELVGLLRKLKG
jgi:DNA-binding MarR family transcriptional regulator